MSAETPLIFLSYAHEDKPLARELTEALGERGCRVWLDELKLRIGDSLVERIADAITDGDFVAAIISPESLESKWCQQELSWAAGKGIRGKQVSVLPIRYRGAEMPPLLADRYWASADGKSVDELADQIARDVLRHRQYGDARERQQPAAGGLMVDSRIDDRYVVERDLGRGPHGQVYLVWDVELQRRAAVKLLTAQSAADRSAGLEAVRTQARLSHPLIASIFDCCEDPCYILSEFVDGWSLRDVIDTHGGAPVPVAVSHVRKILQALSFAHDCGVTHGGLTPANVIVDALDNLKLTDFGIARAAATVRRSESRAAYLPPRYRGDRTDPRCDLHSVGVILHEMLAGSLPVAAGQTAPGWTSVPGGFAAVVKRATTADAQRYESAADMEADVANAALRLSLI